MAEYNKSIGVNDISEHIFKFLFSLKRHGDENPNLLKKSLTASKSYNFFLATLESVMFTVS